MGVPSSNSSALSALFSLALPVQTPQATQAATQQRDLAEPASPAADRAITDRSVLPVAASDRGRMPEEVIGLIGAYARESSDSILYGQSMRRMQAIYRGLEMIDTDPPLGARTLIRLAKQGGLSLLDVPVGASVFDSIEGCLRMNPFELALLPQERITQRRCLIAMQSDYRVWKDVPSAHWKDSKFCRAAVASCPSVIRLPKVREHVEATPDLWRKAIQQDASVYAEIPAQDRTPDMQAIHDAASRSRFKALDAFAR